MTDFAIPGFAYTRLRGADDVAINVAHAGTGPLLFCCTAFRRRTRCGARSVGISAAAIP